MRPEVDAASGDEMRAGVAALSRQLATHVPLYCDAAGTWLVPLHPLLDAVALRPWLEAVALPLFHPRAHALADGTTVLLVPLGEALGVLPFSPHFPAALAPVRRLVAGRPGGAPCPPAPTPGPAA